MDNKRVLSGIIFINHNGLWWRDAPREYGPHKTLYNRWIRWSRMGVFARIMEGLAAEQAECRTIMIPSRCLLRNQLPGSGRDLSQGAPHGLEPAPSKGGRGRLIGRSRGGVNTKLHTVTDREGRPVRLFVTAGQVSGYRGALALQSGFPQADWLIADRG